MKENLILKEKFFSETLEKIKDNSKANCDCLKNSENLNVILNSVKSIHNEMQILKDENKKLQSDKDTRQKLLKNIEAQILKNNSIHKIYSPNKTLKTSIQSKTFLSPSPDKAISHSRISYERQPIKQVVYRKEPTVVLLFFHNKY